MMKKYRIGRVQEPWTNMRPPIQCEDWRERLERTKQRAAAEKRHKRRRSIEVTFKGLLPPKPSIEVPPESETTTTGAQTTLDEKKSKAEAAATLRIHHAQKLEEKEIEDSKRDWPSLDQPTQRAIMEEYRELHDQIKARGLYKCQYSKYGYESIRYVGLFSVFLYLLYSKWYLTSALFLGMFWVSLNARNSN